MALETLLVKGKRPVIDSVYPEKASVSEAILKAAGVKTKLGHKAGGLGEYAAGFDRALRELDMFDVRTFIPASPAVLNTLSPQDLTELQINLARQGVYLLSHTSFKAGIYRTDAAHKDYERALILGSGLLNFVWPHTRVPDIVHCHDWTTGLLPAAGEQRGAKAVYTVHNHISKSISPRKAYQIGFDASWDSDYTRRLFFDEPPERIGQKDFFLAARINMLASGINAASAVNGVSERYTHELIEGSDFQVPDSVRAALANKHGHGRLCGILNNVDDAIRPDATGKGYTPFTPSTTISGKQENKHALQKEMGLREGDQFPVFFFPNRLVEQKGVSLLHKKMEAFSRQHQAQFVIVADGEEYEKTMGQIACSSNGMIGYQKYNERLNMLGFAGADYVLAPSQYEPAGLAHRVGHRFGCFTIGRRTGGIADSVTQYNSSQNRGNGFLFHHMNGDEFWDAMYLSLQEVGALSVEEKGRQRQRIMEEDLAKTAKAMVEEYVEKMYRPCIDELNRRTS